MPRPLKFVAVTALGTVAGLLLVEAAGRILSKPSSHAYATLMGRDLPPFRIVSSSATRRLQDPSLPFADMKDGGKPVTLGDLWGHFRLDPSAGYSYEENFVSRNGWWRSNNIGARANADVVAAIAPGAQRVLVFGESFAHGSRVRQDEAWPNVMGNQHRDVEVVNLAVDGYSMAQAFLRYRDIRKRIGYSLAVLVFVPEVDLWRDVNIMRQLYQPNWDMPLMPRFSVVGDELHLVPPFYEEPFDLYLRNGSQLTKELRSHLRKNDRFYFPDAYDEPVGLRRSILGRLLSRARWLRYRKELEESVMTPPNEALRVSRAIAEAMQAEVTGDGARFVMMVLPVESHWWTDKGNVAAAARWQSLVSFVCGRGLSCVDLLPVLQQLDPREVDRVYDGEHFGAVMNAHIAVAAYAALELEN